MGILATESEQKAKIREAAADASCQDALPYFHTGKTEQKVKIREPASSVKRRILSHDT